MAVKVETGGAKPGLLLLPKFCLALTFRHPKLKAKDLSAGAGGHHQSSILLSGK